MRPLLLLAPLAPLALIACGEQPSQSSESANDFADRVAGNAPVRQQGAMQPPALPGEVAQNDAEPWAGTPPGPLEQGTTTDPNASSCGAIAASVFLGRYADDTTRAQLRDTADAPGGTRFLEPGSTVKPDPASTRLSVMLDGDGMIRDLRCG